MKKAAVLFPGIGYSVDRPLLYYSGKMALSRGYEVIRVPYTGFPLTAVKIVYSQFCNPYFDREVHLYD